jgi:hypothetical protein
MKKNNGVYFLSLIAILLSHFSTQGQEIVAGTLNTKNATYNDQTSVDYKTGILNYNINLFDIKQDGISLPIALSYQAGGIKVSENPGLAGLGWSLSTGCATITRQLRGSERGLFPVWRRQLYRQYSY